MNGQNNWLTPTALDLPSTKAAVFIERVNRFVGMVEVAGEIYPAHVPSSGRMKELLFPGNIVYVTPMPPGGKTNFRILLARFDDQLVSIDSLLPNRLIYKAIVSKSIPEFTGYTEIKKEIGYRESRFDLYLRDNNDRCFVEIKSVTLVDEGIAKFPDAPSERGKKHLQELREAVGEGYRAAVVFVVQRSDAKQFSPNQLTDPAFSEALSRAAQGGVEIYALLCNTSQKSVGLLGYLPVNLR